MSELVASGALWYHRSSLSEPLNEEVVGGERIVYRVQSRRGRSLVSAGCASSPSMLQPLPTGASATCSLVAFSVSTRRRQGRSPACRHHGGISPDARPHFGAGSPACVGRISRARLPAPAHVCQLQQGAVFLNPCSTLELLILLMTLWSWMDMNRAMAITPELIWYQLVCFSSLSRYERIYFMRLCGLALYSFYLTGERDCDPVNLILHIS
jgi:hypothetical protein